MGMGRTADSGDRTNLGRVPRAIQWILTAGHLPADAAVFDGGVLIVETSEELISVREFGYILRSLGSGDSSAPPGPFSLPGRQRQRWATGPLRRREQPTATSSATPSSRSSLGTTLMPLHV